MRRHNTLIKILAIAGVVAGLIFVGTTKPGRLVRSGAVHFIAPIFQIGKSNSGSLSDHAMDTSLLFDVETLTEENTRLKKLLGFKENFGESLRGARVLRYAREFGKEFLLIDQGLVHGVHSGDFAIDSNKFFIGVVGEARDEEAVVESVSNPGINFEIEVIPARVKSFAKGMGGGSVSLEFIPVGVTVKPGDFIAVRSPAGEPLLLGEIVKITPASDGIFQMVEAYRSGHPEMLSEVGVIRMQIK